jgi:nitric oxide reductase NorD protein
MTAVETSGSEGGAASRYALLACAVAGRKVTVVVDEPELSHTDGETIYVAGAERDVVRDAVVVQAALLAAGSLDPRTVMRLTGRKRLRNRYLTLEVARAMSVLGASVPRIVAERVAQVYPGPVPASRRESLEQALAERESIPEPPAWFGAIRPSKVLRNSDVLGGGEPTEKDREGKAVQESLREFDDEEDTERSRIMELFSAPAMRNPLAEAFQKLLGMGRSPQPDAGGGEELPVGGQRAGKVGRHGKLAKASPPGLRSDLGGPPVGRLYPEWNWEKRAYRLDWCSVAEYDPAPREDAGELDPGEDPRLRKELARLGLANERHRRQDEGDVLDITSLIELVVDRSTGMQGDQRVYETQRRTAHDLGALILLDTTGSTGESEEGRRVFDEQRQVVARLTAVLDELGDRVASYGFQSWGRSAVRFLRVKTFDDRYDHAAQRRLAALEPGGFTRLGAAIRHGTHLLTTRAGTSNTLLVVVGDGLPYDDGYEHRYAQEDSRRALREAVLAGVGCACVSVRSATEQDIIERVWGHVPYRRLERPSELASHVAPLFRQALREAAASRRRAA